MSSSNQLVFANQTTLLTTLLPSTTYTLAYSLPLLFASFLLTFAGAFLTLDRSRAFPENYDTLPGQLRDKKTLHCHLEGGVGGLVTGLTHSGQLSKQSFLAVWILSALASAVPSGRWRYCALAVGGIVGGSTFALSISVIIHPSLLGRIVLVSVALPLFTILTLLPLPRFQHGILRFTLSAAGAFGLVLSISLFTEVDSWADAWEHLWVADGPAGEWGNSKEKGMSAAYCFLLVAGMTSDWILRRKFGENPDQKWDSYLAEYSHNLPDRAGYFQPSPSVWTRFFGLGSYLKPLSVDHTSFLSPMGFKSGAGTHLEETPSIPVPQGNLAFSVLPAALKKGRSQRTREKKARTSRDPLKFGDQWSSDSDTESDEVESPLGFGKEVTEEGKRHSRNVLPSFMPMNYDVKDNDMDAEMDRMKSGLQTPDQLDYSDCEEDITATSKDREALDWSPGFLKSHNISDGSSTASQRTTVHQGRHPAAFSTPTQLEGAVPVTPSLIKALDRLAIAQRTAFGIPNLTRPGLPPSHSSELIVTNGLPKPQTSTPTHQEHKVSGWGEFWNEVRDKAAR